MKWIGRIFVAMLILAILAVGGYFGVRYYANTRGASDLASQIEKRTQFPTTIRAFTLSGLGDQRVDIEGLNIENPEGYPAPEFLEIDQMSVDVNLKSLMSERIVINELIIDLGTLGMVVDSNGNTNADTFLARLKPESEQPAQKPKPGEEKEPSVPPQYIIKKVRLQADQLRVVKPGGLIRGKTDKTFDLDFEIVDEDVTDIAQVWKPFARELSKRGAIALLPVVAATLQDSFPGEMRALDVATQLDPTLLEDITDRISEQSGEPGEAVKGLLDQFRNRDAEENAEDGN